ncbi:MAG: uroporphyrinogen-III C-methyltransferase [Syntrophorhabdaceae bacterium]|nr:uroporphyrinogen-III C-methyltransferase [Syntrophorhabdaceae bacterium]
MAKVYLIGAGPGDLKLITVRGLELIQKADVIIYDNLVNRDLLNYAKKDAVIIYAGKQASRHELTQNEINELLFEKAKENNTVVRLKGGDPFIFGRGGEEAFFLAEHGIDFEICPGVTSAISVPAYAGIPLTHRHFASSVAFITGHEDAEKTASSINWEKISIGADTLVFLMGIKNIKQITEKLIEFGRNPDTEACVITNGTLPEQKVVTGKLSDIAEKAKQEGIRPPGIIVVGRVVELRKILSWFEKKPLYGKKIAITRARPQSIKLGTALSDKGAMVIYIPVIEIKPIKPNIPLDEAIKDLDSYFGIIFTSTNSVSIFFDALFENKKDARFLCDKKIFAIGEATAKALLEKGVISDFVPEKWTSEGIVEVLKTLDLNNKKILLPRAEEASNIIAQYIHKNGGSCHVVPIYRTVLPEKTEHLKENPDVITFTSSSTVRNFISIYGKDILKTTINASIGPVTTYTLKDYGIEVHIEAKRHDISGLVEAIEAYFNVYK